MPRLPDAARFRALVDGSDRGAVPALLRGILAAASLPYAAAVTSRNLLYDRGWLPSTTADIPVICIGNLTLGGTGKTPLVAWLVRELVQIGERPVIVSRGYAARPGHSSDEAAELSLLLPGVPHIANRDRAAGVQTAVTTHSSTVAVLDDGFQHRRLHRTLDVVAIDATDPFGCGALFPRGLLREPLCGLHRADAIILTRSTAVDRSQRAAIQKNVMHARKQRPVVWAETSHKPQCLRTADGSIHPLSQLVGCRVALVSGIGNPTAFRKTVEASGSQVVAEMIFPDHYLYTPADHRQITEQARNASAEVIVTTMKDLVKIRTESIHEIPIVALEVAIEMLAGERELRALVGRALAASRPSRPATAV
jgi:tetraacyldisaccharide 4'-kinase